MPKLSQELEERLYSKQLIPVIIETQSSRITKVMDAFSELGIPVGKYINFRDFKLSYVSTYLTSKRIEDVAREPTVDLIHFDRPVSQMQTPFLNRWTGRATEQTRMKPGWITTGTVRRELGCEDAEREGITGKGVRVAVIDSGFSATRQLSFRDGVSTYSTEHGTGTEDSSGHGTFCVNTIAGPELQLDGGQTLKGMAPGVSIASIRALFTPLGMGTNSDILKAIQIAVEDFGANILSMSLGGENATPEDDPARQVIDFYSDQGVIFVIAAGNSGMKGAGSINSPGDVESALTVGSMSMYEDSRVFYSSYGPTADGRLKPDLCALGGGSASKDKSPKEYIVSSTAGILDVETDNIPNRIGAMMGTSMATPEVAGIIALWYQYCLERNQEKLTTQKVKDILSSKSPDKSDEVGYGLINYNMIHGSEE